MGTSVPISVLLKLSELIVRDAVPLFGSVSAKMPRLPASATDRDATLSVPPTAR